MIKNFNLKSKLQNSTLFQPINLILIGLFVSVYGFNYLYEGFNLLPNLLAAICAAIVIFIALYFSRFFIIGLFLGLITFYICVNPVYKRSFSSCEFAGVITKNSQKKGAVYIKASNINCENNKLVNQTIMFWDSKKLFSDKLGLKFSFKSKLSPVKSRLNKYEFSYEKYLRNQGILLSAKNLKIISKQKYTNFFLGLKVKLQNQINKHLSKANSATIIAIITGDRSRLNSHQKDIIQKVGVSHILAISGLHLAIIGFWAWLFMQIIWSFLPRLHKYLLPIQAGAIFAFIIISFYVFLTGFQIPAKRAWVMFFVLALSWFRLKVVTNNSLSLAAVAVILFYPLSIFSVGFYLSFLATFIVLNTSNNQVNGKFKKFSIITKLIKIQIYIPLVLMPITWYYFGNISLIVFVSNLIIIPLITFWLLPLAVLANLFEFISPFLASYLWVSCEFFTNVLWSNLEFFFSFDANVTPSSYPSLTSVTVATAGLLLFVVSKKYSYLLFCVILFIPNLKTTNPSFIIADSKQTSVLIHNKKQAIIINPGRRYKYIDASKKWLKYLKKNNLELKYIILEDEKISKISATKTLLKNYKNAKIIKLTKFDYPFKSEYCKPINFKRFTSNYGGK